MIFATKYDRKKSPPEINSGKRLVEVAGYISAKDRIENLIAAGMRLQTAREELYDFPQGQQVDETFFDPTRSKNYDLADAFQESQAVNARLKASQTVQEQRNEALESKSTLEDDQVE